MKNDFPKYPKIIETIIIKNYVSFNCGIKLEINFKNASLTSIEAIDESSAIIIDILFHLSSIFFLTFENTLYKHILFLSVFL